MARTPCSQISFFDDLFKTLAEAADLRIVSPDKTLASDPWTPPPSRLLKKAKSATEAQRHREKADQKLIRNAINPLFDFIVLCFSVAKISFYQPAKAASLEFGQQIAASICRGTGLQSRRYEMFMERVLPMSLFAPEERDIRFAEQHVALLRSERQYFWPSEL